MSSPYRSVPNPYRTTFVERIGRVTRSTARWRWFLSGLNWRRIDAVAKDATTVLLSIAALYIFSMAMVAAVKVLSR